MFPYCEWMWPHKVKSEWIDNDAVSVDRLPRNINLLSVRYSTCTVLNVWNIYE